MRKMGHFFYKVHYIKYPVIVTLLIVWFNLKEHKRHVASFPPLQTSITLP